MKNLLANLARQNDQISQAASALAGLKKAHQIAMAEAAFELWGLKTGQEIKDRINRAWQVVSFNGLASHAGFRIYKISGKRKLPSGEWGKEIRDIPYDTSLFSTSANA